MATISCCECRGCTRYNYGVGCTQNGWCCTAGVLAPDKRAVESCTKFLAENPGNSVGRQPRVIMLSEYRAGFDTAIDDITTFDYGVADAKERLEDIYTATEDHSSKGYRAALQMFIAGATENQDS